MELIVVSRHKGLVDLLLEDGVIGTETPVYDNNRPPGTGSKRGAGGEIGILGSGSTALSKRFHQVQATCRRPSATTPFNNRLLRLFEKKQKKCPSSFAFCSISGII